jgi:glycosyltransferase involved in cell wall biosynthesis
MKKIAFVIFARDKEEHVGLAVRSVLAQTYSPMDIYFSDQGSTDNTLAVIKKEVEAYNGPNKVHILNCPVTEEKGMQGLTAHHDWLHSNIDADFWILSAADDIDYPDRAKRTVETWQELDYHPLYISVGQNFIDPNKGVLEANANPHESGWYNAIEIDEQLIGGSTPQAWAPELIDKFGDPFPKHALLDVYVPWCAGLTNRFYYLHEIHHAYVRHADPNNTGIGNRMNMVDKDSDEYLQLDEVARYQLTHNMSLMATVADDMLTELTDPPQDLVNATSYALHQMLGHSASWAHQRHLLNMRGVRPICG